MPCSLFYYLFFSSPIPSQRLNLEIMINSSLNTAEKAVEEELGIPLTYKRYTKATQVGPLGQ